MKYFSIVLIFLTLDDISSYLFDDPLYGEVKTTVKHNFLKEHQKKQEIYHKDTLVEKGEKKSRSSRWFAPGCAISNTGSGNDEAYEATETNCETRPTLDYVIQTLCPWESFETYSGLLNGDKIEFSKFQTFDGWWYRFTGKSKDTFYPFWRVYGDFQVDIDVEPCNRRANSVLTTRIAIRGLIQRNDKNIQVEIEKPTRVAKYFINKFDSASDGKIGMMGLLNYIQSGTAGSSFATQGSFFKADVLDNMHWDKFTGTGFVNLDGKFNFIVSSKHELFPSTQERAKMHLIIEGTGQSASSYAFVSSFNNGHIMQTFKQFSTLDRNAVEAYFEFGRVNSYKNWCFILSSNDFVLKTEIEVMRRYQSLFGGCFEINPDFQYEMMHGSTFRIKEEESGGAIICGDGKVLQMQRSSRERYISGHLEAFGLRFSYDRSRKPPVELSVVLDCLNSFTVAVNLPDWILNIADNDVTATFNDIYTTTNYKSFAVDINIKHGSNVQNPLPTDLVPSFAIKKIEVHFGKFFNKAGQFNCYLDAVLGQTNNVMTSMRLSAAGWMINLQVQSMTLKNLFDQLGHFVDYLGIGLKTVAQTTVENLNVLIDVSRRKLVRITGVVTIKQLSAVDIEAVYQVSNGLAVGLKSGSFNFEKTYEAVYKDVLCLGNPPKHTVPWLTSINSMVMISGMSKKNDALFHHPDLATFDDMTAGVRFRFEWNRPDTQSDECKNDKFCTFLSDTFTEGGSFVLSGGYQNKEFEIEGEMNTDIKLSENVLFAQAKVVLKLDHSKKDIVITFGLGAQLKYYTGDPGSLRTPLIFEGYIEFSPQGEYKLTFTMLGKIDKPFGLPHVSVADAQFAIERPDANLKFDYIRFGITIFVGNIDGVVKREDGRNFVPYDAISLTGFIGINPKKWFLSYFSVRSPHPLTLGRLEDMFHLRVLPEKIRQYGYQSNFLIEYSPTKVEDLPNGVSMNAGFRFKGRFKMLAWSGEADINVDLNTLEFQAIVQMEPISWFWGAFKLLDAEGKSGPKVNIHISPNEFKGDISCSVRIFGFETTSTRLIFNEKGVMLKQRFYNLFSLELELFYGLWPIKGRFLFGIQCASLKNFLTEKINSFFDGMLGNYEEAKRKLERLKERKEEFWRLASKVIDTLNGKIDKAQQDVKNFLGRYFSWIVALPNLIVDGVQKLAKPALQAIKFLSDAHTWMVGFIHDIGNKLRKTAISTINNNLELKINKAIVEGSFDGIETAGMRAVIDIEYKLGRILDGRFYVDKEYGRDNENWREINQDYFYKWTSDEMIKAAGYQSLLDDVVETEGELAAAEAKFDDAFYELQQREE